MKPLAMAALALALIAQPALSQPQSPYLGFEGRPIKSLSDQQIGDLRAGRGMGLALAAELNGYPGPAHVLELATSLELTEQQRTKVEALFAAMKAEAIPLGQKLIAQEAELDRQFVSKTITESSLASALQDIAKTRGALRAAHLKYHLATSDLLTPAQTTRYVELRGYASGPRMTRHPGGHQPDCCR
jgi:Spy/CpxP family protein refolding chaperone